MRPLRLAVTFAAVAAATALGATPALAISPTDITAAVTAFQSGQRVFVAPGVTADSNAISTAIGTNTTFIAVFPTTDNTSVSASQLTAAGRDGMYIAITEKANGDQHVEAKGLNVRSINLNDAITRATQAHHGDPTQVAIALAGDVRTLETAANSQTGTVVPSAATHSTSNGLGFFPVLILGLAAVFGFMTLRRRKRQRALEAKQFAEVRGPADEDVTALGESVSHLNFDINSAQPEARQYYEQALGAYDHAKQAMAVARRPEDLRGVSAALEEGRWALAATSASAAGQAIPERRPPCFFNPQHGPSVADVDYSPEGGAIRQVPVCAADLDRVQRGLDPDVRQVVVAGQQVPYWNAGPMYAPWAGGYYGGYGSIMPGIFGGLLLADLLTPSYGYGGFGGFGGGGFGGGGYDQGYSQGYDQGASSGGGGGDWSGGGGGGDWGGGGGDFGGGGDSGGGGGDF
ncbi:MAG: hypothetical protein QOH99_1483 [Frankiaceae bacterium]|nr:hypothetical protein [Frankiaceae bacterium]